MSNWIILLRSCNRSLTWACRHILDHKCKLLWSATLFRARARESELQLVQVVSRVISRHAQSVCFEVRSARPQVFQLFLNLHFTREMSFGPLQLFIPFEVAQKLQLLLWLRAFLPASQVRLKWVRQHLESHGWNLAGAWTRSTDRWRSSVPSCIAQPCSASGFRREVVDSSQIPRFLTFAAVNTVGEWSLNRSALVQTQLWMASPPRSELRQRCVPSLMQMIQLIKRWYHGWMFDLDDLVEWHQTSVDVVDLGSPKSWLFRHSRLQDGICRLALDAPNRPCTAKCFRCGAGTFFLARLSQGSATLDICLKIGKYEAGEDWCRGW